MPDAFGLKKNIQPIIERSGGEGYADSLLRKLRGCCFLITSDPRDFGRLDGQTLRGSLLHLAQMPTDLDRPR